MYCPRCGLMGYKSYLEEKYVNEGMFSDKLCNLCESQKPVVLFIGQNPSSPLNIEAPFKGTTSGQRLTRVVAGAGVRPHQWLVCNASNKLGKVKARNYNLYLIPPLVLSYNVRAIVCLGRYADAYLSHFGSAKHIPRITIPHPSYSNHIWNTGGAEAHYSRLLKDFLTPLLTKQ